jgi:Winged helix-turn helix/DDE domain
VLEKLAPAAWHRTEQYANNRVECDHGRLKARLRPMRGLKQDRSAKAIIAGHAFVQNVRRGHYELVVEVSAPRLSDQQLQAVDQALRQGARAHGFDSDHWTLARITSVIQQLTGVAYHPGHVWKLLRHRLHYRLQRPARRAVERDERAIARWVAEDWP